MACAAGGGGDRGQCQSRGAGDELPPNPQFARFMAEELMPWVQAQGLGQMARRTVVAGSSYGGWCPATWG
jgi:enterochelin esterase family protein